MEEKKKKKLTLSVSSKTPHTVPNYVKSRQKTSVLIEKKTPRRWGEKKFQSRNNNFNKPESTDSFVPKKTPINRNVHIRKLAEERATKRFKSLKEDNLQQKKSSLGKEKSRFWKNKNWNKKNSSRSEHSRKNYYTGIVKQDGYTGQWNN